MAVTAGVLSLLSTGSTMAAVAATAAAGGSTPFSYQWYKSTTSGFVPGSGSIVAGATALLLNDTGLIAGTQYYYSMVVIDSASTPTSATYAQLGVLPPTGKIGREAARLFGVSAGYEQLAQFGSYAANAPVYSTDPITLQSLSAWLEGWFGAVVGNNNPCMEDMNTFCYVLSYFLCYGFQSGIPEYNSSTTYYKGSLCMSLGEIYVSLAESNIGNLLTNNSYWALYYSRNRTVTGSTNLITIDEIVRCDSSGESIAITLPPISATALGKQITIKDVGTGGNYTTVQGNGTDLIDGNNTFVSLLTQYNSVTVYNNGQSWDVL